MGKISMGNLEIFLSLVSFFNFFFFLFSFMAVFRKLVVSIHRRKKLVNGIQINKTTFMVLLI